MNPISIALTEVHRKISADILRIAFDDQANAVSQSIDNFIVTSIFETSLRQDCSIRGGRPRYIPVLPTWSVPMEDAMLDPVASNLMSFSVHRIPPEARDNVDIMSVMDILPTAFGPGTVITTPWSGSTLASIGNRVLRSIAHHDFIPRPVAEVLSGDLIRLTPRQVSGTSWTLFVSLEYDPSFTGMNRAAWKPFAALAEISVRLAIYNKLILGLDQGYIYTGAEYPAVRAFVDESKSARDEYEPALTKFAGFALFEPQRALRIASLSI